MEAFEALKFTTVKAAAFILERNDAVQPFAQFAGAVTLLEQGQLLVEGVPGDP